MASKEGSRLRFIEEKVSNLNRKFELMEKNLVHHNTEQKKRIKELDSELFEVKRTVESITQKIDLIVKEIKMTAGRDELETLKRYLDLWDLTRFATKKELEEALTQRTAKAKSSRKR